MFQKRYTRSSLLLLLNRTCIYLSQRRSTFHAMLLNDNISIFLHTLHTPRHSKRISGTLIHLNIYFYFVSTTNYLPSSRQYKLFLYFSSLITSHRLSLNIFLATPHFQHLTKTMFHQ